MVPVVPDVSAQCRMSAPMSASGVQRRQDQSGKWLSAADSFAGEATGDEPVIQVLQLVFLGPWLAEVLNQGICVSLRQRPARLDRGHGPVCSSFSSSRQRADGSH